jgi:hypothetical protein
MLRKIVTGLLIVFIIIQFIRPAQNKSIASQPDDIAVAMSVPTDVQLILRRACYDCHSNNTGYPWYSYIQPVYWWLNHHIEEGKDELNFSEFGTYTLKRKIKKFNEISGEVTEGEMPLSSYTWMHKEATLTKEEANKIINWANLMAGKLEKEAMQQSIR